MKFGKTTHEIVKLASKSDASVLITGPTGTGKTYLAQEIHRSGSRKAKPFVVVNLASLHSGTFESELFGHERGAFTGAQQKRIGRLELAQGGTVFLDEVGELSPALQCRLLEFLQSRKITRVGGNQEISLDVRVITATHNDLAERVRQGSFREDLFYRLRVIQVPLLPLADREDEFDSWVHLFLNEICSKLNRRLLSLSEGIATRLEDYSWPGNLRELRNVLEYSVLACEGDRLEERHLPDWFGIAVTKTTGPVLLDTDEKLFGMANLPLTFSYESTLSRFEKEYFKRALNYFRGGISRTARGIGMDKATLLRRLNSYDLNPRRGEGPLEQHTEVEVCMR